MDVPQCPVHGPMKLYPGNDYYAGTAWSCSGWDGEGCGYLVHREERGDIWCVMVPVSNA